MFGVESLAWVGNALSHLEFRVRNDIATAARGWDRTYGGKLWMGISFFLFGWEQAGWKPKSPFKRPH